MTIIYTILSITILYFFFAILSDLIKKIIGKKICAICAAVSLTWLGMLLLWLLRFNINPLIIAILMGQSIVGIMYKSEGYFKRKNLRRFWLVRLFIITLGTFFVYFLLERQWSALLLTIVFGSFLSVFLLPLISVKKTREGKVMNQSKKNFQKAVLKLEKLMEDCC